MKRTIITLMFLFTVCAATFAQSTDEQTLLKLDQEFITALRTNDTAALVRLTDSGYQGYNQHGQNNDRAAFLELYKTFKTSAQAADALARQRSRAAIGTVGSGISSRRFVA